MNDLKILLQPHIYDSNENKPELFELHVFDQLEERWIYISHFGLNELFAWPIDTRDYLRDGKRVVIEVNTRTTTAYNPGTPAISLHNFNND